MQAQIYYILLCKIMKPHRVDLHGMSCQICMHFLYLTHTRAIFQRHVLISARLLKCDRAEVEVGDAANISSLSWFNDEVTCSLCSSQQSFILTRLSSVVECVANIILSSV